MAVNVSPLQLRTRDIIEEISGALHDSGVDGSLLELEVTESGVMHDPVLAAEMISALQRLDIISRDDEGRYAPVDSLMREWVARKTF